MDQASHNEEYHYKMANKHKIWVQNVGCQSYENCLRLILNASNKNYLLNILMSIS